MSLKQLLKVPFSGYSPWQRRKSLILGSFVGIIVALLCFINQDNAWLRFAENLIQRTWIDRYYAASAPSQDESEAYVNSSAALLDKEYTEHMVLVVFDDSSLRSGLTWPIPRDLYRTLVHKLKLAGAKTIAFDIIFSGPSADPKADQALREAIADPSVIMPYGLLGEDTTINAGLLYPPLIENWSDSDRQRRLGFTMEVSDPIDKRVRLAVLRVTPPTGVSGPAHYSLTVMALAHYLGITPQEVLDRCLSRFESTDLTIAGSPYAFNATVGRISYCGSDLSSAGMQDNDIEEITPLQGQIGSPGPQQEQPKLAKVNVPPISDYIQVWSVQDILNTPDEELAGLFGVSVDPKTGIERPNQVLALIGVNVPGGYDIKMSDVGNISGASIHANIIWNLMQNTFIKDNNHTQQTILFILSAALIATVLATYFETKWGTGLFVLLCAGYWYAGYYFLYATYFTSGGVIIPVFTPWLGALASFSAVTVRNVLVERNARQTMHSALADVLPVPDIEDWVNNRGLEIGSEERNLTILFSDIRGYTDLSETLNPVDITEMLNTYHEAMGSIFERFGGIIFDYQGDAQMVVFGLAPASQPNHAAAAVKAATGMVLRLQQLRSEWQAQKRPVFECGIGVCTGSVALGVVGSKYRKQICAIGDPTNTSARMQGKSKDLNCPVLMTESTYTAAGNDIVANFIQSVSVKGKREPLRVYGVDFDAMRDLLCQDGLQLDEITVVVLVITLRNTETLSDAQRQVAWQLWQDRLQHSATDHHGTLMSTIGADADSVSLTAIFGWGSFSRTNPALEGLATARELLQLSREESGHDTVPIFACLHTGLATVTEHDTPQGKQVTLQGESGNMARAIALACQGLSTSLVITEATLPAWGNEVKTVVLSTYKVPHKKQTLALYGVERSNAPEAWPNS